MGQYITGSGKEIAENICIEIGNAYRASVLDGIARQRLGFNPQLVPKLGNALEEDALAVGLQPRRDDLIYHRTEYPAHRDQHKQAPQQPFQGRNRQPELAMNQEHANGYEPQTIVNEEPQPGSPKRKDDHALTQR